MNSITSKVLPAAALLGIAGLTLAGCSSGDGGTAGGEPADTGTLTVWLVGTDTPQEARDLLTSTFEAAHDGWTLELEEKTWSDVSENYVAALQSNDAPDVVEVGNTQAIGFIDQGLFADLGDIRGDLGELNPGLEASGTYDDTFYAAPYYAGGRRRLAAGHPRGVRRAGHRLPHRQHERHLRARP
jgi:N,N'-diacetylchitobiose transport system substrate-binding protein